MGTEIPVESLGWKEFVRRHWGAVAIFVVACVLALAGAVYVFWWFATSAESSGLVPSGLGLWTTENLITFILYSIFWELLAIGIPVVIGAVVAWMWWKRLPADERRGYRLSGKGSRTTRGGSGASLLFFIAFCIKVYIDGNWNVPIASFSLDYVVGSIITILVWCAVIFGIPLAIGATWWVHHQMKKP